MPTQAVPQKSSGKQAVLPENALKVDSGKRGFIEYENKDGRLITLLIFDRDTGKELLKKDYPDGVIYEYIDFSQFGLSLGCFTSEGLLSSYPDYITFMSHPEHIHPQYQIENLIPWYRFVKC